LQKRRGLAIQRGQEEERDPVKKKMGGQGNKATSRRHTGNPIKVFKRVCVTPT